MAPRIGHVALVGAGPGDPGLLTLRGKQLLEAADAVVYDRLAHPSLVELAPPDAKRIYVGKNPNGRSTPQEEIEATLLDLAREGLRVVRLKGGDPFVFGRGGEEALTLRDAGIPFEVVPGVTAGVAVPAYAGIPVTHRAVAVGVSFFTGHEDPTKEETQLNLASLSRPGTTGVFYMGRRRLPQIVETLKGLGRAGETPAAVISWGTLPEQRSVTATLDTIVAAVEREGIGAPCITVVGEVVELRDSLAWWEKRPLFGRRIAVTRARAQASGLVRELESLGAEVVEAPAIRVASPEDPEPLARACREVGGYGWVIFTSPNGVEAFFRALAEDGGDARRLAGTRVGVIGSGTADALARHGVVADVVPERFVAEGLLEALEPAMGEGERVLIPRAAVARDVLPDTLRERGHAVDVVEAYRTECVDPDAATRRLFEEGAVDLVTFTSSSTVKNFHRTLGEGAPRRFKVASIGPITSSTARDLGYEVDLEAAESSIPGLVRCLVEELAGA